ncbi:helix-turn-helix domain-containing protein [Candidatus Bathyarchaeota archaeon]|nr:helix-turn-helix domain-containing protein [Candidatus Bathyarchaeota archaeon]
MSSIKRKYSIVLLILAFTLLAPHVRAENYTQEDLTFNIYPDGYVSVIYTVKVDPTVESINLTLFGSDFQYLIVEDQDGLPLDFSLKDGTVTIFSLGAILVRVSYETFDLTNKSYNIWTFYVYTPIPASILLPENSTVVDLNVLPTSIESLNGHPLITMPSGSIRISYILSVIGSKENASTAIKDAEQTIISLKEKGINLVQAETTLQLAKDAYSERMYVEAERLANLAKSQAAESYQRAVSAQREIDTASEMIETARSEGRLSGLDEAEALLNKALEAMSSKDYASSESYALQAQNAAAKAKLPTSIPIIPVVIIGLSIVAALTLILWRRRHPKPSTLREEKRPDLAEPKGQVDLNLIFEQKKNLRLEEKEVLKFLAESDGEAFASDIREHFDIPKTSAWRLIRRLQKEGIVEVRNVGGQNLIRIKAKYRVP